MLDGILFSAGYGADQSFDGNDCFQYGQFDLGEKDRRYPELNLPPCYHEGFILTDRKLFRRDP